jgi:hypothetical protein
MWIVPQQGNEEVLKDQVRQQFRMNMHEDDEEKVGRLARASHTPPHASTATHHYRHPAC